jgi:hypothetical protein
MTAPAGELTTEQIRRRLAELEAARTAGAAGLTAAQIAALSALVAAQATIRGQLTRAAVDGAVAPFRALSGADWWDSGKVDKAVAAALKVVQANQRQAARITDAYIARTAGVMTGRTVRPAGAVDVTKLRKDIPTQVVKDLVDGTVKPAYVVLGDTISGPGPSIDAPAAMAVPDPGETVTQRIRRRRAEQAAAEAIDPADAYGRIADQVRFKAVSEPVDEEQLRSFATVRVASVAQTDVTLAVREQVRNAAGKLKDVRGYRRILHPELTATGPCGLCVVAADRLYHVEDLMPIHSNCVCETLPVLGELDPGLHLNASDLAAIYSEAGGTGGDVIKGGKRHSGALKAVRVALAEHGELGPSLVDADQHYRGPVDVARTRHPDRAVRDQAKLDAFEDQLGVLLRRRGRGEAGLESAIEWQTARIDKLRSELGGTSSSSSSANAATRPAPRRQPAAA